MASFAPELVLVKRASVTVEYAVSICALASIMMDPPSSKGKKPKVASLVYTKAIDVSPGSPPPCVKPRGPAAGLARGYPSANESVYTFFSSLSVSVLSLGRGRSSRAAGATPGDAGVGHPSTPDLDDDDPATPNDDVPPAGAPAIQYIVDWRL